MVRLPFGRIRRGLTQEEVNRRRETGIRQTALFVEGFKRVSVEVEYANILLVLNEFASDQGDGWTRGRGQLCENDKMELASELFKVTDYAGPINGSILHLNPDHDDADVAEKVAIMATHIIVNRKRRLMFFELNEMLKGMEKKGGSLNTYGAIMEAMERLKRENLQGFVVEHDRGSENIQED